MKKIISSIFNSENNSSEFQKLIVRWDVYLSKLKDRYYEILRQAESPLQNMIDNLQYDTVVIHNVKTGLHNQTVLELSKKAEEGWEKMKSEMQKIGVSWEQINEQHRKSDDLRKWMEWEFGNFEVATYGRAARKILENVKKHIDEKKLHLCTQCAAELPIKIYSFIAVNIKCDSCGSVNTYQPDDRIRALEYYVLNHLAEEQAYKYKQKAITDKEAMKDYYKTYYGFLMENVPDKKEFYRKDMEERINNPFFKNTY